MIKYYAGIGSRQTPVDILNFMKVLASTLAQNGYALRTGGARGADQAFIKGAVASGCNFHEVYLPWNNFEEDFVKMYPGKYYWYPTLSAYVMAEKFLGSQHWNRLSGGGKALHARNMHQVLGEDLKTPVKFVVCYAPVNHEGIPQGGTATAMKLAASYGIPVFNLAHHKVRERIQDYVNKEHHHARL